MVEEWFLVAMVPQLRGFSPKKSERVGKKKKREGKKLILMITWWTS